MEYPLILPRKDDRKVRTRNRKPPPFIRHSGKLPSSTVKTSAGTGNEGQIINPPGEDSVYFTERLYFQKYPALSWWGCHLTLVSSAGRGCNGRTGQLSRVTDKWRRFSNSCSNFSVALYGEESRYTPLDFRKGNLHHYLVSTARQNVSACLFSRKFLAVCRGRFDRR